MFGEGADNGQGWQSESAGGYTCGMTYPIKPSANGRYFIDSNGAPFLYNADTGWQVIQRLSLEEVDRYFTTRQAQGFNAIQLALYPWWPSETSQNGQQPFEEMDATKPVEAYFERVDAVTDLAAKHNLLLVYGTGWLGCCGEGWMDLLRLNSPEKLQQYGRYLGERYGTRPNVAFFHGGDRSPLEFWHQICDVGRGVDAAAPNAMQTYHARSGISSSDMFPSETWLDWSMIYAYFPGMNQHSSTPHVYDRGYAEIPKKPTRPFTLGESTYEKEHGTTNHRLRRQAYWTILSGGAGHAMGNGSIWRFAEDWEKSLHDPFAAQLKHWYGVFTTHDWHTLVPDPEMKHEVVTDGYGEYGSGNFTTTSVSEDGRLLMAYIPTGPRTLTVDMNQLKGSLNAQWFDPTNGEYLPIAGSPFDAAGTQTFTTPDSNAEGDHDFVLILSSAE